MLHRTISNTWCQMYQMKVIEIELTCILHDQTEEAEKKTSELLMFVTFPATAAACPAPPSDGSALMSLHQRIDPPNEALSSLNANCVSHV